MDIKKISKFLSYVLRHKPDAIGIEIDSNGWVLLDILIQKSCENGQQLDLPTILEVTRTNDKQRFAISDDGLKIRANQGHSISVDLDLGEKEPPSILYHGTAKRFLSSILCEGLKPGTRHDVHLSSSYETAYKVGMRHGSPVVLEIAAGNMYVDGYKFSISTNAVWLTKKVPSLYIKVIEK